MELLPLPSRENRELFPLSPIPPPLSKSASFICLFGGDILSVVEVLSPPIDGLSPSFLSSFKLVFESGGDGGDIGDIFRLIVIQVEFLDFVFSPFASLVIVMSIC